MEKHTRILLTIVGQFLVLVHHGTAAPVVSANSTSDAASDNEALEDKNFALMIGLIVVGGVLFILLIVSITVFVCLHRNITKNRNRITDLEKELKQVEQMRYPELSTVSTVTPNGQHSMPQNLQIDHPDGSNRTETQQAPPAKPPRSSTGPNMEEPTVTFRPGYRGDRGSETPDSSPVKLPMRTPSEISKSRPPSWTTYYANKRASVFGNVGDFSELYHLCQDYFTVEETSKEDAELLPSKDVPIEAIRIEQTSVKSLGPQYYDNVGFMMDEQQRSNAQKQSRIRPKSYLLQLEDLELQELQKHGKRTNASLFDYTKGMFVRKNMNSDGGEINIQGVGLKIPKNALQDEREICVGIVWGDKHLIHLTSQQALLSPIVVCEPHNVRFSKPVELTIDHCAMNIRSNWNVKLMTSETSVMEDVKWRELTIADYDSRIIGETNVKIELKHFTLYAVVGESVATRCAAKLTRLVAFSPPLQAEKDFKVRVYCVNNYDQQIERREEKLNSDNKDQQHTSAILVHDTEENVCLKVDGLSKSWKLQSVKTQEFPFEDIWHSLSPSITCTCTPSPNADSETEIQCEILSYQKGNKTHTCKLTVAERVSEQVSTRTSEASYSVFPLELRNILKDLLDAPNDLGKDWRLLASKMEMEPALIQWLDSRVLHPSPTEQVLHEWEMQNRTLKEFYQLVKDMERADVADEVQPFVLAKDSKV